ncbi:MAG: tRNA 4-thiouridine(8) synthase ThiI [Deltaproteobacteria bacterium]|nr:MAG: tRNA 4-thiouridine(8) synthase ThiI [Deltaproteobacteria bacterium]
MEHDYTPPEQPLIVLRHGETFLKGANRAQFEAVLRNNITRALRGLSHNEATAPRIERGQGRFFVHVAKRELPEALRRLRWVFGLSSLSPAITLPRDVEGISAVALRLAEEVLEREEPRTFRIRTQRADKSFPLTSMELSREVGTVVGRELELPVDLKHAELDVGLEIGPRTSFAFVERRPAAGGLPVGVSGKATLLLSGGIDSPVAGHLLQKRGCQLHAVYFHAPPHTGERAKDKVLQLAGRLAQRQPHLLVHVVRFTEVQRFLRDGGPAELAVVLYRRAMMRIAGALAAEERSKALVTGENLGQVASQTLENLGCIDEAAPLLVLRPLLGMDKLEIIALAKQIDSYETSILPHEDTCSLFVPKHPATKARVERVREAETKMGREIDDLMQQAIGTAEPITL